MIKLKFSRVEILKNVVKIINSESKKPIHFIFTPDSLLFGNYIMGNNGLIECLLTKDFFVEYSVPEGETHLYLNASILDKFFSSIKSNDQIINIEFNDELSVMKSVSESKKKKSEIEIRIDEEPMNEDKYPLKIPRLDANVEIKCNIKEFLESFDINIYLEKDDSIRITTIGQSFSVSSNDDTKGKTSLMFEMSESTKITSNVPDKQISSYNATTLQKILIYLDKINSDVTIKYGSNTNIILISNNQEAKIYSLLAPRMENDD